MSAVPPPAPYLQHRVSRDGRPHAGHRRRRPWLAAAVAALTVAGALLPFAPAVSADPPVLIGSIAVSPSDNLPDDSVSQINVTATGLVPSTGIQIQQCLTTVGGDIGGNVCNGITNTTTDVEGGFSVDDIPVSYRFSGEYYCDTSSARQCTITAAYTDGPTAAAFLPATKAITFEGHVQAACAPPVGPAVALTGVDRGYSGDDYVGFIGSPTDPNPQDVPGAGATDWRLWGSATDASLDGFVRKDSAPWISELTDVNPGTAIPFRSLGALGLSVGIGPGAQPFDMSWTGGTPASDASGEGRRTGLQHDTTVTSPAGTPHYGFSFTVEAEPCAQDLTLWVSTHHGIGKLTATIGDQTITDSSIIGGQNRGGVYRIRFNRDQDNVSQKLTVTWVLDTSFDEGSDSDGLPNTEGNVVIYGAALSPAEGGGPTPDFSISADPEFGDPHARNQHPVGHLDRSGERRRHGSARNERVRLRRDGIACQRQRRGWQRDDRDHHRGP